AESSAPPASQVVAFHGAHQAGIITPAQDRMHFVSLDVRTTDPAALRGLLDRWTEAAARMTRGEETVPGGFDGGASQGPPEDTGEAFGLAASQLTVTIGYGPSLFDDRFGLAARRPAALVELPPFTGDALEPARTGGDLAIQACANDPQVAVHAVRNLIRMGMGLVAVRWSQLGFGRTSSTSTTQATPRNLMGFKDGTNNLKAEDAAALEEHVWVQPGDVSGASTWMAGGSYLVARRIRMHIEVWDRAPLREQEDIFGRTKRTGAAYGQTGEFDPADFERQRTAGGPLIPATAHIRVHRAHRVRGLRLPTGSEPRTELGRGALRMMRGV
ncbi:MAG: Dyp-type peroxidase, partial [Dermatophilaceae bacterium]